MIRHSRPDEPSGFSEVMSAFAETHGEAIKELESGPWRHYKGFLCRAQYHKCGYCDEYINPDSSKGAVEHYRPKGKVQELDPIDPGTGKRPRREVRAPGYHWLALRWDNYLMACGPCNSESKGNLFPVAGGHRSLSENEWGPGVEASEEPLLLNPFDVHPSRVPASHLTYDSIGHVNPRAMPDGNSSPYAIATIETCDLNRAALLQNRRFKFDAVKTKLDLLDVLAQLPEAPAIVEQRVSALKELAGLLSPSSPHAGLARDYFEQRVHKTWEDILEMANASLPPPSCYQGCEKATCPAILESKKPRKPRKPKAPQG